MLRHLLAPVVAHAAESLGIGRTVARGVALTFDDGPHPEGTPAVLERLEQEGARATFFMVGEQVQRRPALAREVSDRGHLVALHAYRHRLQTRLRRRELEADIERGLEVLAAATGCPPELHRPPYGVYSPAGLRIVRGHGLAPLLWSQWGKDWRGDATPQRIAALATTRVRDRDVILLHDADFYSSAGSHERTVQALELIFKALKERELATVLPV
jgi:peptidoglycan/xylan/chitin deacetylase (PgdA/CDA1 family)